MDVLIVGTHSVRRPIVLWLGTLEFWVCRIPTPGCILENIRLYMSGLYTKENMQVAETPKQENI